MLAQQMVGEAGALVL